MQWILQSAQAPQPPSLWWLSTLNTHKKKKKTRLPLEIPSLPEFFLRDQTLHSPADRYDELSVRSESPLCFLKKLHGFCLKMWRGTIENIDPHITVLTPTSKKNMNLFSTHNGGVNPTSFKHPRELLSSKGGPLMSLWMGTYRKDGVDGAYPTPFPKQPIASFVTAAPGKLQPNHVPPEHSRNRPSGDKQSQRTCPHERCNCTELSEWQCHYVHRADCRDTRLAQIQLYSEGGVITLCMHSAVSPGGKERFKQPPAVKSIFFGSISI